uniref:CA domain-containing protein n=1 Tax=Macrostomum lignano TaxID=282301 RepID=A0A1I8HW40_9PLAT
MEKDGRTSGILRVNRTLDYDAGPDHRHFLLNISATPLTPTLGHVAYTSVRIDIVDFDDLSPQFSHDTYRLAFVENDSSIINVSLATTPRLLARDMDFGINQTVLYKIQSGASLSGQPFLQIDQETGEFKVIRIFDREALSSNEILLQVKAYQTDKPNTRIALATVIVTVLDKNDNRPVIVPTNLSATIAENSAAGTYVTRLSASDLDV